MFFKRFLSILILISFLSLSLGPLPQAHADEPLSLPPAGTMVNLSPVFEPALIKGLTVDRDNPFRFNFIMDAGRSGLSGDALKKEGDRLVKYFFACLTIPEKDLWVNLSPYEKDRIIPDALGKTPLGRDLLEQDYILKQLTASLIYPERDLGKEFWNRVYTKAREMYGTTQIPINTFNKVWIVADKATVYEHNQTAFVLDGHLKVMLEEDYLSLQKHHSLALSHSIASNIVRSIVLPEIEKEVNQGQNFAPLRQIFNSLILASWFKKNLREALLNQVYADKSTVKGVNLADPSIQERIYQQYLQAYKKGVFNYIKDTETPDGISVPRKYFSGGFHVSEAMLTVVKDDSPSVLSRLAAKVNTSVRLLSLAVVLSLNQLPAIAAGPSLSNIPATTPVVSSKDAAMLVGETSQLGMTSQEYAHEAQKEINKPGSGKIPLIDTISDEHGTIDKMDMLLLDALRAVPAGKNIPEDFVLDPNQTLRQQGIDLRKFKGQLFFHNLGDFMDRGPYGVKVYRRSKELIEAGISDFVIGNHDQWMFMNLIGLHLPYYEGFNFYGYWDSYDRIEGKVEDILRDKHLSDPETRKASWWARKLSEFRKYHEHQQKTKWALVDEEINGPSGLFNKVTAGMSEDQKKEWYETPEGKVWNKLRGFDPNVGEVATGVKAVGLVSIVWWEKLLKDFDLIYYRDLNEEHSIARDSVTERAWVTAHNMIKNEIIPDLRKTLEEHIDPPAGQESEWWWRIFEAINFKNYTSPEWWAMDWVYHKGWGPTVFKEINDTYHNGEQLVTTENYLDEDSPLKGVAVLKEIAQFYKDHYTLHIRDIMQIDYIHAFLPIDPKTGEFYFNYKSQKYRGTGKANRTKPYWEGLQRISKDIREAPNNESLIRVIYEAKTVVNGWYADNTTEAKVSHVADALKNIGVKTVAMANGIFWLVTGHLPMHDFLKLTEDRRSRITGHLITTLDEEQGFAFSDGGMGERFGGGAKALWAGAVGLMVRGFPGKKSINIVNNPATVIYKKDATTQVETERVVFRNDNPIAPDIFLRSVLNRIRLAWGSVNETGSDADLDFAMKARAETVKPNLVHEQKPDVEGGIDLNSSNMTTTIRKEGLGVRMRADPVLLAQIRKDGIQSLTPVIYKITPINNIWPLFGMQKPLPEAQLAAA